MTGGVTFFDTSPIYARGGSELALGRALSVGNRADSVICTKFGQWQDGRQDFDLARLDESVDGSLARLGTDYVDVLLLHSPAFCTGSDWLPGALRALHDVKISGRALAIGLSLGPDTAEELIFACTIPELDVVEARFNLMYQAIFGALPHVVGGGVGVVVKAPLESGWLSGAQQFDSSRRRRWSDEELGRRRRLQRSLDRVRPSGESWVTFALRFLFSHEQVSTVVPGVKTSEQLNECLRATVDTKPLSRHLLTALHALGQGADARDLGW
jgi:aryl-alcohol dehydrogenase-like predicted oxidoreductase